MEKLQKLAVIKLSARQASRADEPKRGVITRLILEMIHASENVQGLKQNLIEENNHICTLEKFDVWHGQSLGPRKFRKMNLCKCSCSRNGELCECSCGAIWKMLKEFRETEFYRSQPKIRRIYDGNKMVLIGKHKKCVRFISKDTTIGELMTRQFTDPRSN